jgi:hypothetical protein
MWMLRLTASQGYYRYTTGSYERANDAFYVVRSNESGRGLPRHRWGLSAKYVGSICVVRWISRVNRQGEYFYFPGI